MMDPSPPCPCRTCPCGAPLAPPRCPCGGPVIPVRFPFRPSVFAPDRPLWMSQLADADFSKACVADRVCGTCGGAAFCEHCCGEHHRGHDTAAADDDHAHRRDSFCTGCRVAFCSDLCAHHDAAGEGHEVIPVDDYGPWYCARSTGSEPWFLPIFDDGVQTFRDEDGSMLVPLHLKRAPSWVSQLVSVDFSETCATDRVCNTCGAAGFCEHCCGEHHRGHDTAVAAAAKESAVHRRDSFCTVCRVAFCSDLCAHHAAGGDNGNAGHEVIPIDEYERWYCARCTGTEPWFLAVLGGAQAFEDEHGNLLVPLQRKRMAVPDPGHGAKVQDGQEFPPWMLQLLAANFSKTCARDRVCNTCGGAAFCGHCCGEHHPGHDTAAATTAKEDGSAAAFRRDSFCIGCGVGFCSELCAHHAGHEVIPIDAYGDRHFVRSTGSESWYTPAAFGSIETFEDKDGNLMVPLERKRSSFPEPGLRYRHATTPPAADRSEPGLGDGWVLVSY